MAEPRTLADIEKSKKIDWLPPFKASLLYVAECVSIVFSCRDYEMPLLVFGVILLWWTEWKCKMFGASGDLVPDLVIWCQIWWSCARSGDPSQTFPEISINLLSSGVTCPGIKTLQTWSRHWPKSSFGLELFQQLQATNFQPEKLYWASPEPDILSWYIRWHQWHVNTVLTIFIFHFLPLLKSLRYLRGWGE